MRLAKYLDNLIMKRMQAGSCPDSFAFFTYFSIPTNYHSTNLLWAKINWGHSPEKLSFFLQASQ